MEPVTLAAIFTAIATTLATKTLEKTGENIGDALWTAYSSVLEHRQRVLNNLSDTPSLKSFLVEAIEKAYLDGQKLAIKEGKLAKFGVRVPESSEYPTVCPFSVEQILDEDFYGL